MRTPVLYLMLAMGTYMADAQWIQTNRPYGGHVHSLAVWSDGTGGTMLFEGSNGGVFLSTNNGRSWAAVNSGLTDTLVLSLLVDGTNLFAGTPGGVFLSTNHGASWFARSSGISIRVNSLAVSGASTLAGTDSGVFVSTNGGATWTRTGLTDIRVTSIVVHGASVFAGSYGRGMFVSTDSGASWTPSNSGLANLTVWSLAYSDNGSGGTSVFAGTDWHGVFVSTDNGTSWATTGLRSATVGALAVSGTNIFAGCNTRGVLHSTDYGSSWTAVNSGLVSWNVGSLAVCPTGTGGANLFAGTERLGVFLSTNNGSNWIAANVGLADAYVTSLAVDSIGTGATSLFAGTLGSGVILSTDGGTNWLAASSGLTSGLVMSLATSGSSLFAGTLDDGVQLSTNAGTTWAQTGLAGTSAFGFAADGVNLYVGTSNGVLVTSDNGVSWTALNLAGLGVFALAASPNETGGTSLYAGTRGGGVFVSTNNGTHWAAANSGLTNLTVRSILNSGPILFAGTEEGVFVSSNYGGTWMQRGLTGSTITSLAVGGSNVFVGTSAGVFRSTNDGVSWVGVNSGLTDTFVLSLAASTGGTHLFAGGAHGGIWRLNLSEMTPFACNVYPGDANNDGIVDQRDILPIGYYYDLAGQARIGGSLTWMPQTLTQPWDPVDACYADCDGNGIVSADDVQGIINNWSRTRSMTVPPLVDKIAVCNQLLAQIDRQQPLTHGMSEIRDAIVRFMEQEAGRTLGYGLFQNWPNPFNPSTTIRFSLPVETPSVRLQIFDVLGRLVWVKVMDGVLPGSHEVTWFGETSRGDNAASGVYLYRLTAGGYTSVKRMLLLR